MTITCRNEQRCNANDIHLLALSRLILQTPIGEGTEHIHCFYSCLNRMRRESGMIDKDLLHIFYIILGKKMRRSEALSSSYRMKLHQS